MFVYQFEVLCRNRLGYDDGLTAMASDPLYDAEWRAFLELTRKQIGLVEFADILYSRSEDYVREQRRSRPDYEPSVPPLFGAKEGKIARANSGRDPLFLFSALQRHLGYPEVPRPRPRDDLSAKVDTLQAKVREMETRLRYKRNAAMAAKLTVEAVDSLHEMAGANGIYDHYPLQRAFRDQRAAAGHFSFSVDAQLPPWGLVALGGEFKSPTL